MGKLGIGPVGMTVEVSADGEHLEDAAALEGLGYCAIWLRRGQIDDLEPDRGGACGDHGGAGRPWHRLGRRLPTR